MLMNNNFPAFYDLRFPRFGVMRGITEPNPVVDQWVIVPIYGGLSVEKYPTFTGGWSITPIVSGLIVNSFPQEV